MEVDTVARKNVVIDVWGKYCNLMLYSEFGEGMCNIVYSTYCSCYKYCILFFLGGGGSVDFKIEKYLKESDKCSMKKIINMCLKLKRTET